MTDAQECGLMAPIRFVLTTFGAGCMFRGDSGVLNENTFHRS